MALSPHQDEGSCSISKQGRASCLATGTVALARTQVNSSCSHPPLGTLPASYPLPPPLTIPKAPCHILGWPRQCWGAWASFPPDRTTYDHLHKTNSMRLGPQPGLAPAAVMLSETSWTSDSCEEGFRDPCNIVPQWVTGCSSGTPSHRKTLCGLCHLRHDIVASIALQLQLETAIHPSSPPVAVPGFMAAEAPDVPNPHQQHGRDLQHPYNRLVHSFHQRRGKKNKLKEYQEEIKMLSSHHRTKRMLLF